MRLVRSMGLASVSLWLAACAADVSDPSPEVTGATSQAMTAPSSVKPDFTCTGCDGYLLGVPDTAPIYLVDEGVMRWIPNPTTFNNLFGAAGWAAVERQPWVVDMLPPGEQLPIWAYLAEAENDPAVWLIDEINGQMVRRWITSPAAMTKYHFSWGAISKNLPWISVYSLPQGADLD